MILSQAANDDGYKTFITHRKTLFTKKKETHFQYRKCVC